MKQGKILLVAAIGAFVIVMVMSALARAEDCPPGAKSCKVVIMTDQEIATLEGQNAIFDAAEFANKMGLGAVIAAWKNKIATAPDGHVLPVKLDAPDANGSPAAKKEDRIPLPPEKKK